MLVDTMNRHEVTAEVRRDFKKLEETTLLRLVAEYDRQRKKLKIDKTKVYHQVYPVKTAAKNNWLIFIEKAPTEWLYDGLQDVSYTMVTYYYTKRGLQVLRPHQDGQYIEVFNGHVFTRYNERMGLHLNYQTDVIKSFFRENGYLNGEVYIKDEKKYSVNVCKEGMLLGTFLTEPDWMLHKTFISKDLKRADQDEKEKAFLFDLELDMNGIHLKKPIVKQEKQPDAMATYAQQRGLEALEAFRKKEVINFPVDLSKMAEMPAVPWLVRKAV